MVYRLIGFFVMMLFFGRAEAASLDTFMASSDPAYIQAVAPRFTKWIFENYEVVKTQKRESLKYFLLKESEQLSEWSFSPWPGKSWPRLQFAVSFKKGFEKEATISIFPIDKEKSFAELKRILGLSDKLKAGWIGYGFSLRSPRVFIFSLTAEGKVERSEVKDGKVVDSLHLSPIDPPKDPQLAFAPLVMDWKGWFDSAKTFQGYELSFSNFNFQFLDGAAVATTRKINREFLLENLRILYRANDDYDVLYP